MTLYEVRITAYEPEPHSLTVYKHAEHVMGAISIIMTDLQKEYRGSFRACTVSAHPITQPAIDYGYQNCTKEVLAHPQG